MDNQKQFDNVLNECLEGLLTGRQTVEQCLQAHPEHAAALEPLLRTAFSVNRAVAVTPTEEQKAHVRYHLQLAMAERGKPRRSYFNWRTRWALVPMSVLLVFVMGGSAVLAADGSMPGNPLYPVKIATENVRVLMASSPAEKGELLANSADRRVNELNYMAQKGDTEPKRVEQIAKRFNDSVTKMNNLPFGEAPSAAVSTLAQPAAAPAPALAPAQTPGIASSSVPPEGSANPTAAAPRTQENEDNGKEQTKTAAPAAGVAKDQKTTAHTTAPAPTATITDAERADLQAQIAILAKTHPDQLEKFIDKFPEQSKPAIRRMIQDAKRYYPEVQQKLEHGQGQDQGNSSNNKKD